MTTPREIVIELLTTLNGDNGYNYAYTPYQFDRLVELVEALQLQGLVFTQDVLWEIVAGPDLNPNYCRFEEIGELLNDIFQGLDENGQDIPPHPQPWRHFDPTPRPVSL